MVLSQPSGHVIITGLAGYQVSQQVVSGYVHVGVAQATSSPYQVQAQISSGELELLP